MYCCRAAGGTPRSPGVQSVATRCAKTKRNKYLNIYTIYICRYIMHIRCMCNDIIYGSVNAVSQFSAACVEEPKVNPSRRMRRGREPTRWMRACLWPREVKPYRHERSLVLGVSHHKQHR